MGLSGWSVAIVFMVCVLSGCHYSTALIDDGFGPEERSERGSALINATYSSSDTQAYPDCLMLCMNDPRCMSFNYRWDTSKCDLNNKTRGSCQACFVPQLSSTYMGMAREGSP